MKSRARSCFTMMEILLLCLLLLLPTSSFAADFSEKLSINGFYTFDISLSDGADVDLPSKTDSPILFEDNKANYDNSLVGIQVDYEVTDNLKVTAQAVSGKQTDENNTPTLEWAYFTYDFGGDLALRGGKLKIPFLQGTELRYIGYSRLWVRPLVTFSGAAGFDDYVGGEIIKGASLGEYNLKIQGAYGVADHQLDFVENHNVKLLSTRIEKDESWVNLAVFHAEYKIQTKDKTITINDNAEVFMASVEGELLFESGILNFGYAYGDNEAAPDVQLAYLSLGYRADGWTPYILLKHHLLQFSSAGMPTSPGGNPQSNLKDGDLESNSYSLGLRYNLGSTYCLKAQAEQFYITDNTLEHLGEVKSDYRIYSIALEGVF